MIANDATDISVIVADEHAAERFSLQRIIESEPGLHVTAEAEDGVTALARLQDSGCDVLLLDLGMPLSAGLELADRIHAQSPRVPILVLSMHIDPVVVDAALRGGASGYVAKDSDPEILVAALRRLAGGGRYVDPGIATSVVRSRAAPDLG